MSKEKAFQDGGCFYVESTGELIADYTFLVDNDFDIPGANAARDQFLKAWGGLFEF